MIMHIQSPWHSQDSLLKHFQEYLGIFRDIDAYSATLTGAQPGKGGERIHILKRKDRIVFHHWVKFSIQNVVLRVSRRKCFLKSPKYFPAMPLFLVFLTKCLSKCPSSTNPQAVIYFWLCTSTQAFFFLQNAPI